MEKRESTLLVGIQTGTTTKGDEYGVWRFPKKLKIELPRDSIILFQLYAWENHNLKRYMDPNVHHIYFGAIYHRQEMEAT